MRIWGRKIPLTPNPSPRGRGGQKLPLPLGEGWGEGKKRYYRLCWGLILLLVSWGCSFPLTLLEGVAVTPTVPALVSPISTEVADGDESAGENVGTSFVTPPPPVPFTPAPPLSLELAPTTPRLVPGGHYTNASGAVETEMELLLPANRPLLLLLNPSQELGVEGVVETVTGERVTALPTAGAGEPLVQPLTVDTDGVYRLRLRLVGAAGLPYGVTLLDVAEMEGMGFVVVDATAVLPPNEISRHPLPAQAGENYFILVEPDSTLDPLLELYAPGGFLFTEDSGGVGAPESTLFTAETTATYQIIIFPFGGSSGSYRLRAILLP
jgi:hypothetical protein